MLFNMAPTTIRPPVLSNLIIRSASTITSIPEAPPASIPNPSIHSDGFSPGAIIGIVVAIVFLLLAVPLIAILLRRYDKKRVRETPRSPRSSNASLRSIQEGHSLRSILVTKELSRSSLRMERSDSGVQTPENVYRGDRERERGWSRTEVRGGEGR
jgi:hypothetical protein